MSLDELRCTLDELIEMGCIRGENIDGRTYYTPIDAGKDWELIIYRKHKRPRQLRWCLRSTRPN
jgi:hypothetical protein